MQAIHILLTTLFLVWLATSSSGSSPSAFSSSSSSSTSLIKLLTLEHNNAKWWSIITDGVCSHSSQLLARNLFFGYMFGRVVNNTESGGALWLTFLLSAAGAWLAAAASLRQPRRCLFMLVDCLSNTPGQKVVLSNSSG